MHISITEIGICPIYIRQALLMPPVPADSRDLRPCLIAKTFVLAFQPSLPTHPYKVALAPIPLGVLDKAAIKRA